MLIRYVQLAFPTSLSTVHSGNTQTYRGSANRGVFKRELRGTIRDAQNSTVRERTVVVIPARQTVLEADEAINVRILLESIDKDSDRAHAMMEVTGIRFD